MDLGTGRIVIFNGKFRAVCVAKKVGMRVWWWMVGIFIGISDMQPGIIASQHCLCVRARVSSLCFKTFGLLLFLLTQETPLLLSMLGRSLILILAQPWNHRSGTSYSEKPVFIDPDY